MVQQVDQQSKVLEDIKSNVQTNTDQLKTLTDQLKTLTDHIGQIPRISSGTEVHVYTFKFSIVD